MKDAASVERRDTLPGSVQQEVEEEEAITSAGIADRRVIWQLTAQSLRCAADAVKRAM